MMLNVNGNVYNASNTINPMPSEFFGFDIARDVEFNSSGNGHYVLTGFGQIFNFGNAPFFGSAYFGTVWHTFDNAVDMELTPAGDGYYILDCWGNVYTYGNAVSYGELSFEERYAQDIEVAPDGKGYYILDAFGYVHGFGSATSTAKQLEPGGSMAGTNRNMPYSITCKAVDFELFVNCLTGRVEGWWNLDRFGNIREVGTAPFKASPAHPISDDQHYTDIEVIIRKN